MFWRRIREEFIQSVEYKLFGKMYIVHCSILVQQIKKKAEKMLFDDFERRGFVSTYICIYVFIC